MKLLKSIARHGLWKPFGTSLLEVSFTLIVSNLALFFLVFVYLVEVKGADFTLSMASSVIRDNVKPGEVLVYLLALVAPTLWLMLANWRARRHAFLYSSLLIIQFGVIGLAAYVYGASKFERALNAEFVSDFALGAFVVGVAVWLVVLVYVRWLPTQLRQTSKPSGQAILDEL